VAIFISGAREAANAGAVKTTNPKLINTKKGDLITNLNVIS